MFKKSILALSAVLALNADTIVVEDGWKLYGASTNIDVKKLKSACDFKNLWVFRDREWTNYRDSGTLYELDGFWIEGNSSCAYNLTDESSVKYYKNRIIDEDTNLSVEGATVSLNGIEADFKTDINGNFIVSSIDSESCQLLTINRVGYQPVELYIDVTKEELTPCSRENKRVAFTPLNAPEVLDVTYPTDNLSLSSSCTNPTITLSGVASLEDKNSFIKDIALVLDVSESTGKYISFDLNGDGTNDTVLESELYSANRLLDKISDIDHRVSVVKFSRYNEKGDTADGQISTGEILSERTRVVQGLTTDYTLLESALSTIANEGSSHGTDIARGIRLAIEELNSASSRVIGENAEEFSPSKYMILLTDGRPTLPYEPVGAIKDPNELDRQETITAAYEAKNSHIAIFPIVIQPEDRKNRKLTTVPAIQAITGVSGEVAQVEISSIDELPEIISNLALDEVAFVTVTNLTTNQTISSKPDTSGKFEIEVPLTIGANSLSISANNGVDSISSTLNLTLNIKDETTLLFSDLNLPDSVSLTQSLQAPYESINKKNWDKPLLQFLKKYYPDAKALLEIEEFILKSIDSTITVEYVSKDASYKSDFLYFTYNSNTPPQSKDDVFALIDGRDTELFYFDENKDYKDLTTATVTMLEDDHDAVGFIIVPNEKFDGKKTTLNKSLFSLHYLNAGNYRQFYPLYDETNDKIILAIEDITLTNSDGDFNDAIITLPASLFIPQIGKATCQ
jgi:hypothetical protein